MKRYYKLGIIALVLGIVIVIVLSYVFPSIANLISNLYRSVTKSLCEMVKPVINTLCEIAKNVLSSLITNNMLAVIKRNSKQKHDNK